MRPVESEASIISPDLFLSHLARVNKVSPDRLSIPPRLVMTFHRGMFDEARDRTNARVLPWYYGDRLAVGSLGGVRLAMLHAFMGSAASSMMLEEMIATGARFVVEVGTCGGLVPALRPGDLIIASEGLSDEGTSRHYFRNRACFRASRRISDALRFALKRARIPARTGGIWTTDAPYRETRPKLRSFVKEGAVGVNMETSALLAVAEYRRISAGSIQVVSDLVGEEDWEPAFHQAIVRSRSRAAALAAVRALAKLNTE
jgi:uridine phosphorylase